ncbi:hypothetical protein COCSUDRAFT_56879 [Coccomyxa subellipsoidea C-169]|uniref:Nucleotide-diphospho-sugar transferase domain-containing protein n=1 Tax=Coccomyxa subellipsoidea (strain C-169) TaxID=574566 RepID=I0YTG6_COCSC|nr:hypothetical protein COCSUDRAFT_56879 [Coccomyxa subellipsoidea C-169]EIE21685.1 hypothetical protein COCSUDRAFT_56879 [Coccomyxa subellipsoidea C-169]|eukprot:XP_005646229.1 hypothetical protein COCSUDRAFT_56879 [Coccomyxa subellipsoidea C-169]
MAMACSKAYYIPFNANIITGLLRWEALLVVMDSRPFTRLPTILAEIADDRIWIFAELIGTEYTSKHGGAWVPGYHGLLYNLTDQAFRACPASTEWVLATNGDNLYADTFFDRIMTAPKEADVIAFDFYSRYHRVTDLGANVFRWPRLLKEDRRLGSPAANAQEHQAEHFDGLFANTLKTDGWNIHHVTDACLYDHNPSPQRCAQKGGVWDDTRALSSELGGTCLTPEEAEAHLWIGGNAMEAVEIELSNDGNLASFLKESSSVSISIRGALASSKRQKKALAASGQPMGAPVPDDL